MVAFLAGSAACGGTGLGASPDLTMGGPAPSSDKADAATDAADAMVETTAPSYAPNDGRAVPIHRLSSAEYDNTVRDLLGTTKSFAASLVPFDGDEASTNISAALATTPPLGAVYASAAAELAADALTNAKIVTCDPATTGVHACASQILARFMKRAWRRPVTSSELASLVDGVVHASSFSDGIQVALEKTLTSTSFLFRVESDPVPSSSATHPVTDYELASRLSYFLWSSMPDDALFAFADAGKLSETATFDRQITRMLADPRSSGLAASFASRWLLGSLSAAAPDPSLFPAFDDDLRGSMTGETQAVMASFLLEDRSFLDILDAPFTFLDGRMAAHYGIPGITGPRFVQIPLWAATHRGGLLTQASILTTTSMTTRTSPDRRGEWVLSRLLCVPHTQPKTDPALAADSTVTATRNALQASAQDAPCATCHAAIDPFGFTLERYDAIGRWRDSEDGTPIDTQGTMQSGATLDGAAALASVIKTDPRFPACVTRQLFTYAFERAPTSYDEPEVASLLATFVQGDHRMRNLVIALTYTEAFRTRHGGT